MTTPDDTTTRPSRFDPCSPAGAPVFRTLDPAEADALLRRGTVGRLAVSAGRQVDVQPIHYAWDGAWIYGRTSPGAKLEMLRHSPWVAFEVDEVNGIFDWRSVVVHGALYLIATDGPELERRARRRGVALLADVVPGTGSAADPVPFRTVLFRIHADEITGREASPGRGVRSAPSDARAQLLGRRAEIAREP